MSPTIFGFFLGVAVGGLGGIFLIGLAEGNRVYSICGIESAFLKIYFAGNLWYLKLR